MSILNSLSLQSRVIGALLMREIITRYGRHNIGFLWLFIEPMMFTTGVTIMWSLTGAGHGHGMAIVPFAITGYSSVLLWRNCANRCAGAILPNHSLLFHHQVKVLDIYFARLLLEVAGATMSFIFMVFIFLSLGLMDLPHDLMLILEGWSLLAWFAVSLGFVIGPLSESEVFERFWHTITYLLFPMSGALFLVDWLPKKMQAVVMYVPMVHGTEMLRAGYYGSAITSHYNPTYIIFVNLILTLLGLKLVQNISRKVEIL